MEYQSILYEKNTVRVLEINHQFHFFESLLKDEHDSPRSIVSSLQLVLWSSFDNMEPKYQMKKSML